MRVDFFLLLTAVILLFCLPNSALSQSYDSFGDSRTDGYVSDGGYGQSDDSPAEIQPPSNQRNNGLSLTDIFNYRVRDISEMCPRRNVFMFFATGNLNFLRSCIPAQNVSTGSNSLMPQDVRSTHAQENEPVAETYSGRLLKRILQNMGAGAVRQNEPVSESHLEDKRSRLSVSGPMASLVDMLRHESRGHRRPLSAFHQEMLHMG